MASIPPINRPKAPSTKKRGPKNPKKLSTRRLENIALFYLQRYTSTKANLIAVLMRRVDRSLREHGGEREEWVDAVQALADRLELAGLVDDETYAKIKTQTLARQGKSLRVIRGKLHEKGVPSHLIGQTLQAFVAAQQDNEDDADQDPDFSAAVRLAQRKKLGPFAQQDVRQERFQKHLAVMARAGFSFGLARRVLTARTPEALGG